MIKLVYKFQNFTFFLNFQIIQHGRAGKAEQNMVLQVVQQFNPQQVDPRQVDPREVDPRQVDPRQFNYKQL